MKLQGAECFVGGWGGGGQKNAMTFLKIIYNHIQKIGGEGATTKVSLIRKLYEIARCRYVGGEGNIKRPTFLSFFHFFFFFVDTNGNPLQLREYSSHRARG
jgi:hypothetical protein